MLKEDPAPESRGTEQESQRGPFVVGSPRFCWRFQFFWRGPAGLAGTVHVEVGASRQQQLTTTELVAAALFRQGRRRRGYGGLSGAPIRRSQDFGSRCDGDVMTPRCAGVDEPLLAGYPLLSPTPLRWCGGGVATLATSVPQASLSFRGGAWHSSAAPRR